MTLDLPLPIWRSVRYALQYQIERLERKADRSGSETATRYDRERADNLTVALNAVEVELAKSHLDN
jgi:hypothetical protein